MPKVDDLKVTVNIADLEPARSFIDKVNDLLEQINKADFRDEHGHMLTMNTAYLALKNFKFKGDK
ncbi:hypothetical protein phiCTP1_gp9 [Clostridium phage phiCTP1]|uniref:hypothetical protein n=1 Tax=Clostridium phage phiCTP1 TaxID=871584 RepID=UPI0001E07817|nr:hypothetical protein phiCTP1_gp9 [Clostridium phage phiCTP1]ADL40310.1 hypothetical phage protein [Clostridium phage phiCTP1]